METPHGTATATATATTVADDMANLTNSIVEWRRLSGECADLSQQMKERRTRLKALEAVILRIMKTHQLGTLELKASKGCLTTKETKKQQPLGTRTLKDYLAEYMKSEEEATKVMEFITGKRGENQTMVSKLKFVSLDI